MNKKQELLDDFNRLYGGYVCIGMETIDAFLREIKCEALHTPNLLYDWVLANDMAYEVIE